MVTLTKVVVIYEYVLCLCKLLNHLKSDMRKKWKSLCKEFEAMLTKQTNKQKQTWKMYCVEYKIKLNRQANIFKRFSSVVHNITDRVSK